jgi:hypothetical protein
MMRQRLAVSIVKARNGTGVGSMASRSPWNGTTKGPVWPTNTTCFDGVKCRLRATCPNVTGEGFGKVRHIRHVQSVHGASQGDGLRV